MQRGICNKERNVQQHEFPYPKLELPYADVCPVRRPDLSTDAVQTQKYMQAVGRDRVLTKEPLTK